MINLARSWLIALSLLNHTVHLTILQLMQATTALFFTRISRLALVANPKKKNAPLRL